MQFRKCYRMLTELYARLPFIHDTPPIVDFENSVAEGHGFDNTDFAASLRRGFDLQPVTATKQPVKRDADA